MDAIALPEILIVMVAAAFWLSVIGAAGWALLTLHRIRVGQDDLRQKLSTIERGLQGRGSQ
jgi:hypothetical protein